MRPRDNLISSFPKTESVVIHDNQITVTFVVQSSACFPVISLNAIIAIHYNVRKITQEILVVRNWNFTRCQTTFRLSNIRYFF